MTSHRLNKDVYIIYMYQIYIQQKYCWTKKKAFHTSTTTNMYNSMQHESVTKKVMKGKERGLIAVFTNLLTVDS